MRVNGLFLANHAYVSDGLLHVTGGGWNFYRAEALPETYAGLVAGLAECDDDEVGQVFALKLSVFQGDRLLSQTEVLFPCTARRHPFAIPVGGELTSTDDLKVVLSEPGGVLATTVCRVEVKTPEQGAQRPT